MFSGAHLHAVDNKGRTVIPAKFRTRLGERFYLTKGMHGCLWVFSDQQWPEFQRSVTPRSVLDGDGLKIERFFVGSAVECIPDGQGRIFIPQDLREHARIENEIWAVGVGDKVEIWSTSRWEAFNQGLTDEVIEQLGQTLAMSYQSSS